MKESNQKFLRLLGFGLLVFIAACDNPVVERAVINFNDSWYFSLEDSITETQNVRNLSLPHDWSIEGEFDPEHPAGVGGGALPGGIGWYVKEFELKPGGKDKKVFIQFDGVYQNSTIWINGEKLGTRPNGYISFEYDLTPYVSFESENRLTVKVDNSQQPNSRWYSGSGIYRDVRLVLKEKTFIPQYGVYITTPEVNKEQSTVAISSSIKNDSDSDKEVEIITSIYDPSGNKVGENTQKKVLSAGDEGTIDQTLKVINPKLWSTKFPNLYEASVQVVSNGQLLDEYKVSFGIRYFAFDEKEGFSLNGEMLKIKGVCLHHDLGCLGAAFNERAMERQLEIMQEMGANAIRTAHNPPAPQVLELCDRMGILVMDEMFDMWRMQKSKYDYGQYWDDWYKKDLEAFIKRDRNHPSVIVWSVGNEILEQYNHADSTGGIIARELAGIVRNLDPSRPITTGNNDTSPDNPLIKYGGLDLVGFNYHHEEYESFPDNFPGKKFIATETNSELSTRGHYDMPSDSVRIWPLAWDKPFEQGNPANTVSAYDHVRPPWGSTHEATWRIVKNNDFISGMFIWTGFDYLGEPTPYSWPSKSSYFGLVDLAGFTKDTYFMYKSEWSDDTVLHVFPHWNMPAGRAEGEEVDVWAYYNHADEVELFLNGQSLGIKSKPEGQFHVMWRLPYQSGTLRAVSRLDGEEVAVREIKTAGKPAKLRLSPDRSAIRSNADDLSFVKVEVLDDKDNLVPYAENQITFSVEGSGQIIGVDNGNPVSHESFQANERKAFHGLCLAVVEGLDPGVITIKANALGLQGDQVKIKVQ